MKIRCLLEKHKSSLCYTSFLLGDVVLLLWDYCVFRLNTNINLKVKFQCFSGICGPYSEIFVFLLQLKSKYKNVLCSCTI